jgi:hypothetical protein
MRIRRSQFLGSTGRLYVTKKVRVGAVTAKVITETGIKLHDGVHTGEFAGVLGGVDAGD